MSTSTIERQCKGCGIPAEANDIRCRVCGSDKIKTKPAPVVLPQHKDVIRIGNQVKPADAVFMAFQYGLTIGVWSEAHYCWIEGQIQAINLESGYQNSKAGRPEHLLVTLMNKDGTHTAYLRVKE